MYRIRIAIALAAVLAMAACGKSHTDQSGESGPSSTRTLEKAPPPETAAREAIPEGVPEPVAAGFALVPAGDTTDTSGELVVRPGGTFHVWVLADTREGARPISAAQYSLRVPDGVTVLHEDKVTDRVLTLGSWSGNFMITFPCRDPGLFAIMRYEMKASESFAGGEIRVMEGVPSSGQAFLGFATCEDPNHPDMVPARGEALQLVVR